MIVKSQETLLETSLVERLDAIRFHGTNKTKIRNAI